MAFLTVISGSFKGKKFELTQPVTRIGRREGNDWVLAEPSISGTHCEISKTGTSYYVKDLGSTNGTRVNGEVITSPTPLFKNDILMFGDVSLEVDGDDMTATQKIDPSSIPRTTIVIPQKAAAGAPSKDFQKKSNGNGLWIVVIIVLVVVIAALLYVFINK